MLGNYRKHILSQARREVDDITSLRSAMKSWSLLLRANLHSMLMYDHSILTCYWLRLRLRMACILGWMMVHQVREATVFSRQRAQERRKISHETFGVSRQTFRKMWSAPSPGSRTVLRQRCKDTGAMIAPTKRQHTSSRWASHKKKHLTLWESIGTKGASHHGKRPILSKK